MIGGRFTGPQRIVCSAEGAANGRHRLGRMHRMAAMQGSWEAIQDAVAAQLAVGIRRSEVFFEEWATRQISKCGCVLALTGIAGGDDCLLELAGAIAR